MKWYNKIKLIKFLLIKMRWSKDFDADTFNKIVERMERRKKRKWLILRLFLFLSVSVKAFQEF